VQLHLESGVDFIVQHPSGQSIQGQPAEDGRKEDAVRGQFCRQTRQHLLSEKKILAVADDEFYLVIGGKSFQIGWIVSGVFSAGRTFDVHDPAASAIDEIDVPGAIGLH
jgi:hypothetical protein